MWGEHGGNGGTGEKSMLGRIRGFDDDESAVGSENGGGGRVGEVNSSLSQTTFPSKFRVTREWRSQEKKRVFLRYTCELSNISRNYGRGRP